MVSVNEIIPVRDDISERASVVAKRNAAVHASTCLDTQTVSAEVLIHLMPIEDPHWDGSPSRCLSVMLEESSNISHAGSDPSLSLLRGQRIGSLLIVQTSLSPFRRSHHGFLDVLALFFRCRDGLDNSLVILGYDLLEVTYLLMPAVENH